MSKRIIALMSLVAVLLTIFCSCAMDEEQNKPTVVPNATTGTEDIPESLPPETGKTDDNEDAPESLPPETSITEEESDGPHGQVSDALHWLQQTDKSLYYCSAYGTAYRDGGMYGILSLDGTKDTGAIFYNAEILRKYFTVVTRTPSEPSNLEDINATGLVDGDGKFLIPAEYALIKSFGNDRYFQVFKATEVTQDQDNYLIYLTSKMFSLSASEDDILYKGNWYVYDVEEGKIVDGVSAGNNYSAGVTGDKIFYTNDDKKSVSVNTKGQPFPSNATVMDNGSYYIKDESTVYDAFGQKLFSYTDASYEYIYYYYGYYLCQKYQNGERISQILDQTGTVVSAEFRNSIQIIGENMILMDEAACDFQGNKHIDAVVDSIRQYGDFWYLSNYDTKDYYLLDSDFQLLYAGNTESGPEYQSYTGCIVKKDGNNQLFYSFKQKDFIYQGAGTECGLVVVEGADGLKTLVNTRNDEVLASGYNNYTVTKTYDGRIYIYATIPGGRDIFVMD